MPGPRVTFQGLVGAVRLGHGLTTRPSRCTLACSVLSCVRLVHVLRVCADEWWLMKEAKARNPALKLYGLPWGWPGWLDPSASATVEAKNAFANPDVTANYTLGKIQISRRSEARPQPSDGVGLSAAFLLGAKRVHGLHIDYMGQWNERNAPKSYNDALRRVVGTPHARFALESAAVRNPMWQARLRS